ncbi:MAG: hypothetical protein E6L09_10690 [Verrucomicrobia bacterium]|nr:MAG: hypothetical protein E6L09_10690 [Verrucomicrobiota bacterium]
MKIERRGFTGFALSIKDFLQAQRLSNKGDSQTTPQPPNQGLHAGHKHGFSRRGFIYTAAGASALAFGPGLSLRALAHDDDDDNQTPPASKPIPGGSDLSGFGLVPPYDFIHVFSPGPVGIVLPFSGGEPQGLNVEPSTITDFRGATAMAYHIGEAKGSDGNTYNLETDIRAMEGKYVAVDGKTRRGSFALI